MATVYEALLERKTTKQLGKELTSIMNVKLTQLLKTTCNIDLSIVESPFRSGRLLLLYMNPLKIQNLVFLVMVLWLLIFILRMGWQLSHCSLIENC